MPRFRETIPIDDYILDVLMRDLIGHDQQPAAYLVYLYLYGQAARKNGNRSSRAYERLPTPLAFPKARSKRPSQPCAAAN